MTTGYPTDAEPERPVKGTVIITGRDGVTTTYAFDAAAADEERTKVTGHPLDVRFTFSDVEYVTPVKPECRKAAFPHDHHHRGYPCDGYGCEAEPDSEACA